jgi:HlyD family secretion protein
MRVWLTLVVVIAVAVVGGGLYVRNANHPTTEFRTTTVHRGDVVSSISAGGTVEPEEVVDVGAQVAGQVVTFGKDTTGHSLDFGSEVEANMLLAKIDDTTYKADVDVAKAQLGQAKTAILKAQADLGQAKSKLLQAQNNWDRASKLGPSDALSQNDYDMYQADYETAKANVAIADSEIAQAKDGVPLAQAELDKAQRSLDYCTVNSPVKGVILDRRVNVGQTVVSSLNTPSLFLIARDLSRMQIWVNVNEADVRYVIPGAPVTFTCDAFPERVFDGKVDKIRLNAQMNQNVVLYTVVIDFDNSKRIVLPYMTAKVQFEIGRDTNQLVVPNLALRWTPASTDQVSPDARSNAERGDGPKDGSKKDRHGMVWIKDGSYVRPLDVKLGVTDRVDTAVFSDTLKDGSEIIVGDVDAGGAGATKNPFMPPMQPRHRG